MVIGILGAFGKMNSTSSNLFRRRQFCASIILYSRYTYRQRLFLALIRPRVGYVCTILLRCIIPSSQPAVPRTCGVRDTNLSPRPWAMMTVAVCLFKAGTINGAAAAMVNIFDLDVFVD